MTMMYEEKDQVFKNTWMYKQSGRLVKIVLKS